MLLGVVAPLALGALATLALPPFGLFPLLVPAFTGLLILIARAARPAAAFRIGWLFGLGHFASGLYWIANALLIDVARFWWLIPFAVLGLPAVFGLFTGVVAAATRAIGLQGMARSLLFAALWVLAEYARGHILSGFPWNLVAYAWSDAPAALQSAAYVGAYGLSFLTVLAAGAPAALLAAPATRLDRPDLAASTATKLAVAGVYVGLAAIAGLGWARLPPPGGVALGPDGRPVMLRLVQPNIPQTLKWDPSAQAAHFAQHLEMSARPGLDGVAAVIWAETALPYNVDEDPVARAAIRRAVPLGGTLLTGAVRVEKGPDGRLKAAWNSLLAIDDTGSIVAAYDKAHLVPFGEYVPLRGYLPIDKITPGAIDFSAGPGPRVLTLPGLPAFSPMVCYEIIFPHDVVPDGTGEDPAGARWLLNVTNDGWYGYSTGPFQHFAIAAMRAVEEGVPMVRVAYTGISGVADAYGRTTAKIGLEEQGILDVALPPAAPSPTLYAQLGDAPVLGVAFVVLVFGLVARNDRRLFRRAS